MEYTIESLVDVNASYHHEHRVTDSDVQKANRIKQVIESTCTNYAPRVGDIVQYTNKYGDHYAKAHIENMNEGDQWVICEQPMIPFAYIENGEVYTSTSGGAWSSVPAILELVGTAQKMFKDWGHCGPCGGGAFRFMAEVNVWRYTEGNPEFSTEHYDKLYAAFHDKPVGCGYLVTITKNSTAHTAFRTVADYLTWLGSISGIERPAAWENSRIVWAKKS